MPVRWRSAAAQSFSPDRAASANPLCSGLLLPRVTLLLRMTCRSSSSGAAGPAHIRATSGYLRLWPDSVRALGLANRSASPELSWSTKLQLSLGTTAADRRWPLSAIYLLTGGHAAAPLIEPINTATAIAALAQQFFRPHYIHALGQLASLLPQLGKIVAGTQVFRISRPTSYDHLQTMIETIQRTALGGVEGGFERS